MSCHKLLNFQDENTTTVSYNTTEIQFTESNFSIPIMIAFLTCLFIVHKLYYQHVPCATRKTTLGSVTWQFYMRSSTLQGEFNSLFQSEDSALAYDTAPWHSCALTLKWERESKSAMTLSHVGTLQSPSMICSIESYSYGRSTLGMLIYIYPYIHIIMLYNNINMFHNEMVGHW